MGQEVIAISSGDGRSLFLFFCPGCECAHAFDARWTFNGDLVKPTFHPSLLVSSTKTCHSFVTNGMIQFLGDCTHPLAGRTVPLPPWDSV